MLIVTVIIFKKFSNPLYSPGADVNEQFDISHTKKKHDGRIA